MTYEVSAQAAKSHRLWSRSAKYDPAEAIALVRLASPVAMVALVSMAMSVTDSIMASKFGPESFAAVAVGSDFYSIVFYFMAGTIGGIAPAYASACARGRTLRLQRLRTAGWLLFGLTSIVAVPLVWFAPDYMSQLGLEQKLLDDGAGYTRAMALTLVPMLAVTLFRNRLTALERPGLLLRVTASAVPLNAALNYVLMFGVGSWGGFGVTGAGISSFAVALFIALALGVMCLRIGDTGLSPRVEWTTLAMILSVGVPIGVTTLAELGIYLGSTLYVASFGAQDVAAHALALRLSGVTYAIPLGILQAAMVRTARLPSADSIGPMRHVIGSSMVIGLAAGVLLFLALIAFAEPLSGYIFDSDGGVAVQAVAVGLIFILAVILLVEPAGLAAAGIMRGRRDTRPAMYYSLFGNWCVSAPLGIALSLGLGMGVTGVWLGLAAGTLTASFLCLLRLRSYWRVDLVSGSYAGL